MYKLLVLAAALFSLNAQASYYGPLLSKSTSAGYAAPGYRTSTHCEIYPDKVVLTLSAEGIQSVQERKIRLSGGIDQAIKFASKRPIEEEAAPTDGPALVYQATLIFPNDDVKMVDLGSYTGDNGKRTKNESAAARGLRNFLDLNCR